MDCREFEKEISDFIKGKMDYARLKEFTGHAESCEKCKEELTIQFLVTEGMIRLEDGSAFDLQKELRERMERAKHRVHVYETCLRTGLVFEILMMCGVAAVVLMIIL